MNDDKRRGLAELSRLTEEAGGYVKELRATPRRWGNSMIVIIVLILILLVVFEARTR